MSPQTLADLFTEQELLTWLATIKTAIMTLSNGSTISSVTTRDLSTSFNVSTVTKESLTELLQDIRDALRLIDPNGWGTSDRITRFYVS